MRRPKGKFMRISSTDPSALGRCDISGFIGKRADFVEKIIAAGTGYIGTNIFCIPKFWKKPNPSALAKVLSQDPIPVNNPRPDVGEYAINDATAEENLVNAFENGVGFRGGY